ncbi:MAG: Mut7-C RNAse domain-containing protein [Pseudomonadota bacterium]
MPKEPRFCANRNLGRLARWLRILGYDTLFLPQSTDRDLLAHRDDGRIVLTRKTKLKGQPGVVFIAPDDPHQQLFKVVAAMKLVPEARLSRCSACNLDLVEAQAEDVEATVPEHVRLTQRHFRRCPSCGRIYWPGSHVERMRAHLQQPREM